MNNTAADISVLGLQTVFERQAATTDDQLVELWLHGRSIHTQRAYAADIRRFCAGAGKPLPAVTLADLQNFADSMPDLAPTSRYRILSAVKSLLGFGHQLGYLPFDVGRALRLPSVRNRLAERILPEADVHRILSLEPNQRNRALLLLLYASGGRVSEVCNLRWRDVQAKEMAPKLPCSAKERRPARSRFPLL